MPRLAVAFLVGSTALFAQQPTFNFVSPATLGRITLPPIGASWQPAEASLYDDGTRPVLQYRDKTRNITLSVVLFPNQTGAPTAESCRDSLIPTLVKTLRAHDAEINGERDEVKSAANGTPLATAGYVIEKQGTISLNQQNLFAFAGDKQACAELHLSKVNATAEDHRLFTDLVDRFAVNLSYKPVAQDYETMGVIFFEGAKNFPAAATFYQRASDALLPDQRKTRMGRYIADQLTMAYGMSGDLNRSRETAKDAIAVDPEYPLYYYNLACADAESGDASDATVRLQQAFDRRSNTLQGEPFPDPTQDVSLQKLKSDKAFWDLATKISTQLKK